VNWRTRSLPPTREATADVLKVISLEMPIVDVWEQRADLKVIPKPATFPLSAPALAGEREKALAAGYDEFDTKPIEVDRLVTKVHRLVANARALHRAFSQNISCRSSNVLC
jgi:CheY-like chemotaxis protein